MRANSTWPILTLLLWAAGAQAEMYKWVGPDGKITYSDTPPPKTAARVETKNLSNDAVNTAGLPFELAEATRNSPVTLYTAANCAPCSDGRKLLSERGIPFSEKTVDSNEDVNQFRKLAGADARLPVLFVGRQKQQGFESTAWNGALSAAGYPESNKLPKTYRNPPPQATVPKPVETQQPTTAANERPASQGNAGELPPPAGKAPPGFRF